MDEKRRTLRPLILAVTLMMAGGCSLPLWQGGGTVIQQPHVVSNSQEPPQAIRPASGQQSDIQQLPPPRILPMNEQVSLMSQRMANLEDDRKVLATRLQLLETQLDEKERALAAATREIQDSTAQIVRTRNELQQWKKDTKTLRDRFGSIEKENRETLENLVKTLEQVLERERDPSKALEMPGPELLPVPKR